MALTSTIYKLTIELADVDRSVYQTLELRVARHPSETVEYMLVRILAYCLEYGDGIALTEGIAAGDEPAILGRDLTGQVNAWIEVGLPDPQRLHRGSKLAGSAGRVAIYTHRDVRQLVSQLARAMIHRSEEIPIFKFDSSFIDDVAALLDRRSEMTLSITERELYLNIAGQTFQTSVVEHRI